MEKMLNYERANTVIFTEEIRNEIASLKEELTDERVLEMIEEKALADMEICSSYRDCVQLVDRVFYKVRRDLDILEPLAEDKEISEIMVNGKDEIFVEKNGHLMRVDISFDTTEELEELIQRIAAGVHREINEMNPIVDARLPDGSRVNAVYKNIALNGPILTIRKFPEKAITMETLIKLGSIT